MTVKTDYKSSLWGDRRGRELERGGKGGKVASRVAVKAPVLCGLSPEPVIGGGLALVVQDWWGRKNRRFLQ